MKICYNCFHETESGSNICSHCGADLSINDNSSYPNALPCGSVLIERYLIGRVLGQGGFGITYAAREVRTGEILAIKEYFPDTLASRDSSLTVYAYNKQRKDNFESGKTSFLEEAKTLAKFINMPHIVGVRSYFEENGTAYFVMEYVKGTSLKQYLRQKGGKISWQEAVDILSPILDALADVHSAGIVHRDVTPDNIAITESGTVKLLDFGAARYSIGEKSQSLDVILKHGYAPYEQYMHRSRQGAYTDVYSLAATFYNAITGTIPPESVERVMEDSIALPSSLGVSIPPYAEEALMKALALRPEDRLQNMQDFKFALKHGLRALERRHRLKRIYRFALPLTAAVILFTAVVFFYMKVFPKWKKQDVESSGTEAELYGTAESSASDQASESASSEAGRDSAQKQRTDIEILAERAEKGNAQDQIDLGNLYYSGEGVEQSYEEALKWYTKAAEQGSAAAQFKLGYMYQHGEGTGQSYEKALQWFLEAAQLENSDAQYSAGYIYEHGLDTRQDDKEALKWYVRAAENGNINAQYSAASMYETGRGTDIDLREASKWYQNAAEMGHIAAQNSLGLMYKYGRGVEQDDDKAFEWFEKSAGQGNADAQNNVGMAYYEGRGTEQNYEKALEWYEKAAEQGHASARNNMGWMYAQGLGTDQDNEKAFEYFEEAAEQGHPAAQYNLGYIYMEGIGRDPDYDKAREWFLKAADQEYGAASFSLGEIYLRGLGVDSDEKEAEKWYEKAAEQGYEEARTRLDSLQ